MCQKRSSVNGLIFIDHKPKWIRVDPCMRHLINSLSMHGYRTVGCCCGHGHYPMTIICQVNNQKRFYELISGIDIPRTKRFYKKDKDGYYYVPELVKEKQKNDKFDKNV